jgi:hypothetical protein
MAASPCSRCAGPTLEAELNQRPYWLAPLQGETFRPPDTETVYWIKTFIRHTCYVCGHTYYSVQFRGVNRG